MKHCDHCDILQMQRRTAFRPSDLPAKTCLEGQAQREVCCAIEGYHSIVSEKRTQPPIVTAAAATLRRTSVFVGGAGRAKYTLPCSCIHLVTLQNCNISCKGQCVDSRDLRIKIILLVSIFSLRFVRREENEARTSPNMYRHY